MSTVSSGVYPVYENVFKIGTAGVSGTSSDLKTIKDMETFSVSIDGGIEEWSPIDQEGWKRRLMTAKALTISLSGKRCIGDDGNDYIAGKAWADGLDCTTAFEWDMPSGGKIAGNVVINVTTLGGDSTAVDALEFELQFDGKPTYTAPTTPASP